MSEGVVIVRSRMGRGRDGYSVPAEDHQKPQYSTWPLG